MTVRQGKASASSLLSEWTDSLHGSVRTENKTRKSNLVCGRLRVIQYKWLTRRAKVDSGHSTKVDSGHEGMDSGQGKVVHLDTSRSRKSEDDEELTERIKDMLLSNPQLSDRYIAS
jgi:hypothetical protein